MSTEMYRKIWLLFSVFTSFAITRTQSACLTINSGSPCTFPFTYQNSTYDTCTGTGHGIGRPWCSIHPAGEVTEDDTWGYCDVGCPTEPGCPPGWVRLSSGCYQFMEVEGGVGVEKAEYICEQFGAHLIDIKDVEEKWKVFQYFKEEVMNRQCFEHGKAFWIGNTYDKEENYDDCLAWVADPYFAKDLVSDNYIITNVSCAEDAINSKEMHAEIFVHPLCEKDIDIIDVSDTMIITNVTRNEEIEMVTEPSILKSVFTALFSLSSVLFKIGTLEQKSEECLPGFTKLSTGCYLFTKLFSNYQEAFSFCETRGSELLKIESFEEFNAIDEYMEKIERMNCEESYGWWIQDYGVEFNDTSKYSMLGGPKCRVAVFGQSVVGDMSEWQNQDICNSRNFTAVMSGETKSEYILPNPACEQRKLGKGFDKKNEIIDLTSLDHFDQFTKLFGNCFGDWVTIGRGCYQFVKLTESVTQEEAQNICEEKGGNLVEINTLRESDDLTIYYMKHMVQQPVKSFFHSFFSNLVNMHSRPTGWWTGAEYNSSSGTWKWGKGGREMEFDNWHEFNKHEVATDNCAVVYDDSRNSAHQSFGWLSLPCLGRGNSSSQDILLLPLCEK